MSQRSLEANRLARIGGDKVPIRRVLRAQRDPEVIRRVERARQTATNIRQMAEYQHQQQLAHASRYENYAALMERGVDEEEARRVAFRKVGP